MTTPNSSDEIAKLKVKKTNRSQSLAAAEIRRSSRSSQQRRATLPPLQITGKKVSVCSGESQLELEIAVKQRRESNHYNPTWNRTNATEIRPRKAETKPAESTRMNLASKLHSDLWGNLTLPPTSKSKPAVVDFAVPHKKEREALGLTELNWKMEPDDRRHSSGFNTTSNTELQHSDDEWDTSGTFVEKQLSQLLDTDQLPKRASRVIGPVPISCMASEQRVQLVPAPPKSMGRLSQWID